MIWLLLILIAILVIPVITERLRNPMDEDARRKAPGQFATLSQGITHYEWLGPQRGPVAVCIHGLTTPSFVWRGVARGLALMGFRVLVYDLFGRGYSDRPSGPQDSAFFLRQLNDLLEREGVGDDITVIGYSMGGAIATAFAATSPGRVRQLILLAPAGMGSIAGKLTSFIIRTPLVGDWLMLALYPTQLRRGLRAERDVPTSVEEIGRMQDAELDWRGFVPAVLSSLRGMLSEVRKSDHERLQRAGIPVLAIWGSVDTVIPLAAVGTLTKWNRKTRQEVISGAGHGLPYTHTDDVLHHIREFIREPD